jgi:hypothetical protein
LLAAVSLGGAELRRNSIAIEPAYNYVVITSVVVALMILDRFAVPRLARVTPITDTVSVSFPLKIIYGAHRATNAVSENPPAPTSNKDWSGP